MTVSASWPGSSCSSPGPKTKCKELVTPVPNAPLTPQRHSTAPRIKTDVFYEAIRKTHLVRLLPASLRLASGQVLPSQPVLQPARPVPGGSTRPAAHSSPGRLLVTVQVSLCTSPLLRGGDHLPESLHHLAPGVVPCPGTAPGLKWPWVIICLPRSGSPCL